MIQPLDQAGLQRGAEHLHHLGPRMIAEFMVELAGRIGGLRATQGLLNEHQARLTLAMILAAGANGLPTQPLREVPR